MSLKSPHICGMNEPNKDVKAPKNKPYKERKAEKRYSVCLANGELVGLWGNLLKLCEDMKATDPEFLSYSSLSKRRLDENPVRFKTAQGEYAVYIEKIR